MKLTKIFAGMAAAAIAATAMATTAFAADKGPNGSNGVSVFGIYIPMTEDEAKANGILMRTARVRRIGLHFLSQLLLTV